MASQKKRRKLSNLARKDRRPQTGPFVHADGDRRHRASHVSAKVFLAQKKLMRELGLVPDDPEPS